MAAPTREFDARAAIDRLIDHAAAAGASDVHLDPTAAGFSLRRRIDGLLDTPTELPAEHGRAMVNRLMVMANLLTYRLDIPQEGTLRAAAPSVGKTLELRLAIMPTTHGLRAVVRLPAELIQPRTLDALDLPEPTMHTLRRFAETDTGLLLLTGPAGSGKTTTIYALLDHIACRHPGLSLIALEDPVERDLPGVTQIQVAPHGELTYQRALRSIVRQDPQVLMLGEIRDAQTASAAVAAALTGHRLIATLHAGSPAAAIARLIEMQLQPYQITSALFAVINQRLLRRLDPDSAAYRGRVPIAESVTLTDPLRRAILDKADAAALTEIIHRQPDHLTLRAAARRLIASGVTDQAELIRVLGEEDSTRGTTESHGEKPER